jgi:RimJ/RimL family protein N-acetyltransferase
MSNLMQYCELAIAPASSVAYEALANRMYLITGYYADNQTDIYDFLVNNQLATDFGDFRKFSENSINTQIKSVLNDFPRIKERTFSLRNRICKNINIVFHELCINIRIANQKDVATYFEWANEPEVRNNSLNPELIIWENHIEWFNKRLKDSNTYFYFFEYQQNPLGQVRFEIKNNVALINYSVDKKFRGKGLAKTILLKAMSELKLNLPNISFEAYVKKANTPSILVFKNLNFEFLEEQNEILRFILR